MRDGCRARGRLRRRVRRVTGGSDRLSLCHTGRIARNLSREALLADYAVVLTQGFCSPDWVSGSIELNADEAAWIEALEREAATDEIRLTHTWQSKNGGWDLIVLIAHPRHDREYGLPRPHSMPHWRQRFERDWGQRLMIARRRVAAEQAAST